MLKVFTVYDSKAEGYLQPFFAQATGAGIRSFTQAASEQGHQFNTHGADYTLFEIGTWDELKGVLEPYSAMINLGTALALYESEQPEPMVRKLPVMGGE